MSIGDAERFVAELFNTIFEGLKVDKQVIVNSLGTFKKSVVKDKETITFTPDVEIARQINAPFENFKTVEITVDLPDEIAKEDDSEKAEDVTEENISEESTSDANAKGTITENESEEGVSENESDDAVVSDTEEDSPAVEEKVDALTEKVDALAEEMEKKKLTRKRLAIVATVAVFIVLLIVGGNIYNQHRIAQEEAAEKERIAALKAAEIKHKQDSIDNVKKNIAAVDLTDEQKRLITGEGKKGVPEYPCTVTLERAKELLPHAAYNIVGTQVVVEVEEGQSLMDIAAIYGLQRGEFLIQYHNALESVKEGQKIRIPLLEHK